MVWKTIAKPIAIKTELSAAVALIRSHTLINRQKRTIICSAPAKSLVTENSAKVVSRCILRSCCKMLLSRFAVVSPESCWSMRFASCWGVCSDCG